MRWHWLAGPTCCVSGSSCVVQGEWYSQCTPSGGTSPPPPSAPPPASGSSACLASADGFSSLNGGTTGGAGGTTVTVTNQSDLDKYASASGRHVIKVQGRITITPFGKEVRVSSDKTIVGIGSTGQIYQGAFHYRVVISETSAKTPKAALPFMGFATSSFETSRSVSRPS